MAYTSDNCCCTQCCRRENLNFECMDICTSRVTRNTLPDCCSCSQRGPIIWGNVYDDHGVPLKGCQVNLAKCQETCSTCSNCSNCSSCSSHYCCSCPPQACVICQTRTDMNGYYEFELPSCSKGRYRIAVNFTAPAEGIVCKRQNCICYY